MTGFFKNRHSCSKLKKAIQAIQAIQVLDHSLEHLIPGAVAAAVNENRSQVAMGIILKPAAGSAWGVAGQSAYGASLILSLVSLTP
jgi:hypothetical protein